ncbi:MAG: flavodoxin family protein [Chitinophagaceae bacterium]|nr:MAG: flavodoxin family protein [Chitinophagaceae bacterium]
MRQVRIAIAYHSAHGHTARIAAVIARQLKEHGALVSLVEASARIGEELHAANLIVFGTPTHFGNVAAPFKAFMDGTGAFWYRQLWKGKLAAGFTVSSTTNGDKLHTLVSLALFAAQHGMVWVPLGVLPRLSTSSRLTGRTAWPATSGS